MFLFGTECGLGLLLLKLDQIVMNWRLPEKNFLFNEILYYLFFIFDSVF